MTKNSLATLRSQLQHAHEGGRLQREEQKVEDIALRWDQAMASAAARIGHQAGPDTRHGIPGAERKSKAKRLQAIARTARKSLMLQGHIHLRYAPAPVRLTLDLRKPALTGSFACPAVAGRTAVEQFAHVLECMKGRPGIQLRPVWKRADSTKNIPNLDPANPNALAEFQDRCGPPAQGKNTLREIEVWICNARVERDELDSEMMRIARALVDCAKAWRPLKPGETPKKDQADMFKPEKKASKAQPKAQAKPKARPQGFEPGDPVQWEYESAQPQWRMQRGMAVARTPDGENYVVLVPRLVQANSMKRCKTEDLPDTPETMIEFWKQFEKHDHILAGSIALTLALLGHPGNWETAYEAIGAVSGNFTSGEIELHQHIQEEDFA